MKRAKVVSMAPRSLERRVSSLEATVRAMLSVLTAEQQSTARFRVLLDKLRGREA